jgi:hypothetical protein
MPVGNGGKFTEESGAIYELVLEMQSVRQIASFLDPMHSFLLPKACDAPH